MTTATKTRTYTHSPVAPTELIEDLVRYGRCVVDLEKVAAQYGDGRTSDDVKNKTRAGIRMAHGQMFRGVLATHEEDGKLVAKLTGPPKIDGGRLPKVLANILERGLKVSPIMVQVFADLGYQVDVNKGSVTGKAKVPVRF